MSKASSHPLASAIVAGAIVWFAQSLPAPTAQSSDAVRTLRGTEATPGELRQMTDDVRRMERDDVMRVASAADDLLLPGHRHERLEQYHLGLKVVGGSIVRQTANGIVTSILGQVYRTDGAASNRPTIDAESVAKALRDGGEMLLSEPVLVFLGLEDGNVLLAFEASAHRTLFDARKVYIDAQTGIERLSLPLRHEQASVGEGLGVLNDRKKIATNLVGGTYYTEDKLRPPVLLTIDMRSSVSRFNSLVRGDTLFQSDLASDGDNNWADPVAVDAHTYLGWTYDFLFKRLAFRGLNNGNVPMFGAINLFSPQQCLGLSGDIFGTYCINAFWMSGAGPNGLGMMYFGNGFPTNLILSSSGQSWGPLAGALDVVAHELGHGVTDYTSRLVYQGESGALNEAFSDMIGTSVEAYFQTRGSSLQQADYLLGEDVIRPGRSGALSGLRSMQSPAAFGDPDHYSGRYTGAVDNGGVHSNSGIPNHAFYLAIEGGTNRVSGRAVTGVGFANRDQIEKVFFRAFTTMLPVRATFAQARAATIQSARDLYPSNAAVERAVTDAWTAVGVQCGRPRCASRRSVLPC